MSEVCGGHHPENLDSKSLIKKLVSSIKEKRIVKNKGVDHTLYIITKENFLGEWELIKNQLSNNIISLSFFFLLPQNC